MKLTLDIDLKNETHRKILQLLLGETTETPIQPAPPAEPEPTPEESQPTPTEPEPTPADEMDADALRAIVVEAHKKIGKPEANAIVKKYGAGISKIDPSEYQTCADELRAAMNDA